MKHGVAFGEHIHTEKIKRHKYKDNKLGYRSRSLLLPLVLLLALGTLLYKLIDIQIVQGSKYQEMADVNRLRTRTIYAPRGVIFDRNGTPLVLNIPGFRQVSKDKTEVISKEKAMDLIVKGAQNLEVDSLRQYPLKDVTAHLLGYIGQISKDELENPEFATYEGNDWVGKTGIERSYESTLRGINGKQLVEVDAFGRITRLLGQTDPIPGGDVTVTIDSKLQKVAYDAASDIQHGTVIVSKPNGEVLAMVSKPSYDPNLFSQDTTYKPSTSSAYLTISDIITDSKNHPLLNRAIAGMYPPGSTFKLIVAAAGLENHIIDEHYHITDTGILKVGDFSFANWFYTEYGGTEKGDVNVVRALARSNDIFFYKLAEKISVDKISETARKFGLGNMLGIDLTGEQAGVVPTKEWKKKQIKEDWFLGDTYHYGIGQGYLLTTPLQVNSWTQIVANGGTLYQPRLNKDQPDKILNKDLLSEKSEQLIREGMVQACSPGGVAFPLFNFGVNNKKLTIDNKDFLAPVASSSSKLTRVVVACKTGTAEHGGGDDAKPHAWITLFAPAYKPEIVVTVLSEESGEGSVIAAPVAKKILEAYFNNK